MQRPKWMIIANPKAGKNTVLDEWDQIDAALRGEGVDFDVVFSKSKYHAIELTIKAIKDGYRYLIAIGGDGTIHEVVNGIFMQSVVPYQEIVLGVMPAGSGNDWVRVNGIPSDYKGSAKIIAQENLLWQDIFKLDYYDSKVRHTRYVMNGSGVGLDAMICGECNKLKSMGKSGSFIYVRAAVRALFKMRSKMFEVEVDGKEFYRGKVISIAMANGVYSGGGMIQAPDAQTDDGLANVTIIEKMSYLKIIYKFKELFTGKIYDINGVYHTKGKSVKINVVDGVLPIEIDGESVGCSPVELNVLPHALRVVVGDRLKLNSEMA